MLTFLSLCALTGLMAPLAIFAARNLSKSNGSESAIDFFAAIGVAGTLGISLLLVLSFYPGLLRGASLAAFFGLLIGKQVWAFCHAGQR